MENQPIVGFRRFEPLIGEAPLLVQAGIEGLLEDDFDPFEAERDDEAEVQAHEVMALQAAVRAQELRLAEMAAWAARNRGQAAGLEPRQRQPRFQQAEFRVYGVVPGDGRLLTKVVKSRNRAEHWARIWRGEHPGGNFSIIQISDGGRFVPRRARVRFNLTAETALGGGQGGERIALGLPESISWSRAALVYQNNRGPGKRFSFVNQSNPRDHFEVQWFPAPGVQIDGVVTLVRENGRRWESVLEHTAGETSYQRGFEYWREGRVPATGEVVQTERDGAQFAAVVRGTQNYSVCIDLDDMVFAQGRACNCPMGQRDIFCKHLVALALYVIKGGMVREAGAAGAAPQVGRPRAQVAAAIDVPPVAPRRRVHARFLVRLQHNPYARVREKVLTLRGAEAEKQRFLARFPRGVVSITPVAAQNEAVVPDHNHTEGFGLTVMRAGQVVSFGYYATLNLLRAGYAEKRRQGPSDQLVVRDYGHEDDAARLAEVRGAVAIPGLFYSGRGEYSLEIVTDQGERLALDYPDRDLANQAQTVIGRASTIVQTNLVESMRVEAAAPAPDLGLSALTASAAVPPVVCYRSPSGKEYQFRFVCMTGNEHIGGGRLSWAAFPVSQPSYEGRDTQVTSTHRVGVPVGDRRLRYGNYYCCWSDVFRSEREARGLAVAWVRATEEYVRSGRRF